MAMDITPHHPVVKEYLKYVPKSSDPKVRELWTKMVHEPAYKAVHRYQPILKAHAKLDQVFRFQDLDALVDKLEGSGEEDAREVAHPAGRGKKHHATKS
jgi:hypothetical protein